MAAVARKALSPTGPVLPPPPPGVRPASPATAAPTQQRATKQHLPSTEHMKMSDVLLMLDEKLKPFSFQFRSKSAPDTTLHSGTATSADSTTAIPALPFPIRHAEDLEVLGIHTEQEVQHLKRVPQPHASALSSHPTAIAGMGSLPGFAFLPQLPVCYSTLPSTFPAATPSQEFLVASMQRSFQNLLRGSTFVQASSSGLHSMVLALSADLARIVWSQYDSNKIDALQISSGAVDIADLVRLTVGDRQIPALGGPCACLSIYVKGCDAAFAELLSTDLTALQDWIAGLSLLRDITPS